MRSVFRVGFQRERATRASAPLKASAMKSATSRRNIIVMVVVAAAAFGVGQRRAEAQLGVGTGCGGYGFVLGGFSEVPKPESFLYQKALIDAGRGTALPSRGVSASNPNSYINHIRDNLSVDRYNIGAQS